MKWKASNQDLFRRPRETEIKQESDVSFIDKGKGVSKDIHKIDSGNLQALSPFNDLLSKHRARRFLDISLTTSSPFFNFTMFIGRLNNFV